MRRPHLHRPHLHLRHSSSGRDAALDRLRWMNRSVLAGSLALTAFFADTAANTFAGAAHHKTKGSARHGGTQSGSSQTRTTRPGPLAPPSQAPQQPPQSEPEPEATPSQEAAPRSEEAPAEEAQPAPEAQSQEAAPAQEEVPVERAAEPVPEEGPVVSGAS